MSTKTKTSGLCIKIYTYVPKGQENTRPTKSLEISVNNAFLSLKDTFSNIVPRFNTFGNDDTGCHRHINTLIKFEKAGKLIADTNEPYISIPTEGKPLTSEFYRRSEIATRLNGESDFHFIVTNKKIHNPTENNHGTLFYMDDVKPGNIALFSINKDFSRPHFKYDRLYKNNSLVKQYKNLRFGVFLMRNLMRFVGGQDFSRLHDTTVPGAEECLMFNSTSKIKKTSEWLTKNLDFKLCPECNRLWRAGRSYDNLENIEVFVSAVCQRLSELRDKFIFNLDYEIKKKD